MRYTRGPLAETNCFTGGNEDIVQTKWSCSGGAGSICFTFLDLGNAVPAVGAAFWMNRRRLSECYLAARLLGVAR